MMEWRRVLNTDRIKSFIMQVHFVLEQSQHIMEIVEKSWRKCDSVQDEDGWFTPIYTWFRCCQLSKMEVET